MIGADALVLDGGLAAAWTAQAGAAVAPADKGFCGNVTATAGASGWFGRRRRDPGQGGRRQDPAHANESRRTDELLARPLPPQETSP